MGAAIEKHSAPPAPHTQQKKLSLIIPSPSASVSSPTNTCVYSTKKPCLSSFLRPLPPFLRRQTPACTVTTTNRASSSCPREEANGTVRVWCWWLLIHRARNRISLGSTRSSSMLRLLAPASSQTQTLKRRPSFSAESANQIARKGMEIDSIRSTASRIPTSASILPGIYRRSDRPGRTRPDWI